AGAGGAAARGPDRFFDMMARGKPSIVIADVPDDNSRGRMLEWAQRNGITNGQLTREQWTSYLDEQRAAGGFGRGGWGGRGGRGGFMPQGGPPQGGMPQGGTPQMGGGRRGFGRADAGAGDASQGDRNPGQRGPP